MVLLVLEVLGNILKSDMFSLLASLQSILFEMLPGLPNKRAAHFFVIKDFMPLLGSK